MSPQGLANDYILSTFHIQESEFIGESQRSTSRGVTMSEKLLNSHVRANNKQKATQNGDCTSNNKTK
jgi:hypothetical protein